MLFDLEVRPQAGTPYFQPYTTTVEAGTSSDALNRVKRQYPGCDVWVTSSYNAPVKRGGGGMSSGGAQGGLGLAVLLLIGAAMLGGGSGDKTAPTAPVASPERYEAPAPAPAAAPQWKNYANPPGPCVTDNFEPC